MRVTVTVLLDDGEVGDMAKFVAALKDLGFEDNEADADGRRWLVISGNADEEALTAIVSEIKG